MPSRGARRRADGRADGHREPTNLVRLAGTLLLCLIGGFALVGVVDLVLRLTPTMFAMAGLFVGVATWLPVAVPTRSLPGERDTGGTQ
jgi:hypothetical protein